MNEEKEKDILNKEKESLSKEEILSLKEKEVSKKEQKEFERSFEDLKKDKILEKLREDLDKLEFKDKSEEDIKKEKKQIITTSLEKREVFKKLIKIAKEKGVAHAVAIAKKMNDPFIIDVLHDILAQEGFYNKFEK